MLPDTVALNQDGLSVNIIDQTLLPGELRIIAPETTDSMCEAIRALRVRGAPAIGVYAACCAAVLAARTAQSVPEPDAWLADVTADMGALAATRPTAVNLFWALRRQRDTLDAALRGGATQREAAAEMLAEAARMVDEDIDRCRRIGEHGLELLPSGTTALTHCNAGALATVRYGTALAPFHVGRERGYIHKVYADETRPLLQGARLTAYELAADGIDVTVAADNMAASLMAAGKIDAVIVGADRIAKNGDAANKIGTLGVAVLAKHFGVPFYVAAPTSTFDPATPDGAHIEIEQRDGGELRSMWYASPMIPEGAKTYNPAFDVTPRELIAAYITEDGVIRRPALG
jgi:methylthioribose-1-phosphate isomerase